MGGTAFMTKALLAHLTCGPRFTPRGSEYPDDERIRETGRLIPDREEECIRKSSLEGQDARAQCNPVYIQRGKMGCYLSVSLWLIFTELPQHACTLCLIHRRSEWVHSYCEA